MPILRHHLLGLKGISANEINSILDIAKSLKEINTRSIKKIPTLRGKTILHFFCESSTRTRISFEIAAKRLSADIISFTASTSSCSKGETLIDTAKNLEAMSPDLIIMRHPMAGSPHLLAKHIKSSIINAGDGTHEHPSQGLLDLLTIREKKKHIEGLNVSIIGDINHSRVARSDIIGLNTMGANIRIFGPRTLLPPFAETLGVNIVNSMNEAIDDADVLIMLRVQNERIKENLFPSLREYAQRFSLTTHHLKKANPDLIILHPGPINRGIEITPEVADGKYSVILNQVANGVAIRMALLYLIIGTDITK